MSPAHHKPAIMARKQPRVRALSFGLISISIFLSLAFCGLVGLALLPTGLFWVPYPLHSSLLADYSADAHSLNVQPVALALVKEILEEPGSTNQPGAFATLQAGLQTPVPTVTPRPSQGIPSAVTPLPTSTPAPKITEPPIETTSTAVNASTTPEFSPSPVPTSTPVTNLTPSPTANRPYPTLASTVSQPKPTRTDRPPATKPPPATRTPQPTHPPTEPPTVAPTVPPTPVPTRAPTRTPRPNSYPPPSPYP